MGTIMKSSTMGTMVIMDTMVITVTMTIIATTAIMTTIGIMSITATMGTMSIMTTMGTMGITATCSHKPFCNQKTDTQNFCFQLQIVIKLCEFGSCNDEISVIRLLVYCKSVIQSCYVA